MCCSWNAWQLGWSATVPFCRDPAFAHALLLLAEEAGTLRTIRDHVEVRWYPPGSFVVEEGEAAYELFLVLSGAAEVWKESYGGRRDLVGRLGWGNFSESSASLGVGAGAPT